MSSAAKLVVLVTGGNTGLGWEIAKALYTGANAYDIVIGSRSVDKGNAAIEAIKSEAATSASTLSVVQADLESDASLEGVAAHLTSKFGRLDFLINNGGQGFDMEQQKPGATMTPREMWNKSWDVNVTGTQLLTEHLVPLLLQSSNARIIFMTSGTASLTETFSTEGPALTRINSAPPAGWPKTIPRMAAYRSVKTGLNMAMREWARLLRNDGVKCWSVSPGFLATGLAGIGRDQLSKMGAKDPSEGGKFVRDVCEGKYDHQEGQAIRFDMVQPW